ncbi:hypothetical protein V1525DRAFT_404108 [Lipomyces kononenkoae]|uniref:Uncharacterized protein n=1 Tax=Lipomyces kononenkoae TaxID=34357 RepID=A0ACC3T101_LIPKO
MPRTPVRRLVIHHDAADHNKENIPPSFSADRNSKQSAPLSVSGDNGRGEYPGTHHSALKTVYTTLSRPESRMPLREIFVSSPATPENAFVEYFISDTSLVESPVAESRSTSASSARLRKSIASRESTSTSTTIPSNDQAINHNSTHKQARLHRPAPTTTAKRDRHALAPKSTLSPSSAVAANRASSSLVSDQKRRTAMRSVPESKGAKPKQKSKIAQAGTKPPAGMVLLR